MDTELTQDRKLKILSKWPWKALSYGEAGARWEENRDLGDKNASKIALKQCPQEETALQETRQSREASNNAYKSAPTESRSAINLISWFQDFVSP